MEFCEVLTFMSVVKILRIDHSNAISQEVLSCGAMFLKILRNEIGECTYGVMKISNKFLRGNTKHNSE